MIPACLKPRHADIIDYHVGYGKDTSQPCRAGFLAHIEPFKTAPSIGSSCLPAGFIDVTYDNLGPFIMEASVSTTAMSVFLRGFSEQLAPDVHAMLVLDGAGWHVAAALQVPHKVTLVKLHPYAPELNPVERVWLYLRERFLSHRPHADQDAVVDAACKACRPGWPMA